MLIARQQKAGPPGGADRLSSFPSDRDTRQSVSNLMGGP